MSTWERWMMQPQNVGLRRVLFQVHLWTGIALGLYILVVSVSGVVLIYRNELFRKFSPQPRIVAVAGPRMEAAELKAAAQRAYPGYTATEIREGKAPDHAVEISLRLDDALKLRLFDPYTGQDLGNPLPVGFRLTSWLLDLHDNLLAGRTGRKVNGIGAFSLVLMSVTGIVIWWPGIRNWRRSLTIELSANWKRLTWSLHSALGFWCLGFVLMWGITGLYLSYPQTFTDIVDYLEPFNEANPVDRIGDRITYWLGYLHFGRFGRRVPGCGPTCNSIFMAVWAVFGIALPLMFITGVLMWWNRVIQKRVGAYRRGSTPR